MNRQPIFVIIRSIIRGLYFNHGNLAINAAVDGRGVVLSMKALVSDDISAGRLVTHFEMALPLE